jgi:hypothetical protein
MTTRFFIEGFEVDINEDVPVDLNFSIADITDFDKRNTSFSKTIKLPGTSKNKKVFGHIYEIGSANPYDPNVPNVNVNFNPTKRAAGKVYQNNIIVFDGVVRLITVEEVFGQLVFEINLFGRTKDLFFELQEKTLNDLDFSSLDHVFDLATITAQINNKEKFEDVNDPGFSGFQNFVYPLIDFGNSVDMIDFPLKNFKCCLFLREIWDRIHSEAGFKYDAPFLDTDFFKHLIFVKGDKNVKITQTLLDLKLEGEDISRFNEPPPIPGADTWSFNEVLYWDNEVANNAFFGSGSFELTYLLTTKFSGKIEISFDNAETTFSCGTSLASYSLVIDKKTAGSPLWIPVGGTGFDFFGCGFTNWGSGVLTKNIQLEQNDQIRFRLEGGGQSSGFDTSFGEILLQGLRYRVFTDIAKEYDLKEGTIVNVSDIVPKKFKQRDFIKMIVQYFNLYVVEDKDDPKKLKYTPFPFFYDYRTATAANWTGKIDRSKPTIVKPIGELVAREYILTFASDSDFYSESYSKIFNREYGEFRFENENEFELDSKEIKLPVAPPLMREQDEPRVMLHLYKVENDIKKPDNFKPRIAYFNRDVANDPSRPWRIVPLFGSPATFVSSYPYAGHLDNPNTPTIDILFDRPLQIYFDVDSGSIYPETGIGAAFYQDLFDRYSDKDSKVVTAYFNLDAIDIQTLDFARLVRIGNNHFVVQKVEEYSPNQQSLSKVTLIKVSKNLKIQDLNFILQETSDFLLQENNSSKFYI